MKKLFIIQIIISISIAIAVELNVPSDYSTIQSAIEVSNDGDVINVSSGTYIENVVINNKNLTLIGENSETTIINGNGDDSAVSIYYSEIEITGFTIENGNSFNGGGINIEDIDNLYSNEISSTVILHDLIIQNNEADWSGGGLFFKEADVTINNVKVLNNSGTHGGGVKPEFSILTISNSEITNNNVSGHGGGAYFSHESIITMSNVLVNDNYSNGVGNGITMYYMVTATLTNVTIANNEGNGSGIGNDEGLYLWDNNNVALNNCIIWGNNSSIGFNSSPQLTVTYSDIAGGYSGEGNINFNPLFEDDYTLSLDSPCIDSGDPNLPLDSDGSNSDIGFYGLGVDGCTDSSACNYNDDATIDDNSCYYPDCAGVCDGLSILDQCGICEGDGTSCLGCIDDTAANYDETALIDDGTCIYLPNIGCTDSEAYNYNPEAVEDDGNCYYTPYEDYSLYFNGVDVVKVGDEISDDVINNFTIEFWANPEEETVLPLQSTNAGNIYDGHNLAIGCRQGAGEWGISHSGAGVTVGVNGVAVMEHSYDYLKSHLVYETPLYGWNHFAIVYENRVPTLFINGEAVAEGLTSPHSNVHLGLDYNDGIGGGQFGRFNGYIDDVRIWNSVRSSEEIAENYYELINPNTPNLHAYWNFNENSESTVTDLSSSGYHGTIHGAEWSNNSPNFTPPAGCTDVEACNFNYLAMVDGEACEYPEQYYNCEGLCINDADEDGICDEVDDYITPPAGFSLSEDELYFHFIGDETSEMEETITITNTGDDAMDLDFSILNEDGTFEITDVNLSQFTYGGEFEDHSYYVSNSSATWTNAQEICENNGGYLATISSEEENEFVRNLYSSTKWIGFTDQEIDGDWQWVTGEEVSYTNWYTNEPNGGGAENYCHQYSNGYWNDGGNSSLHYILEVGGNFIPLENISISNLSANLQPESSIEITISVTNNNLDFGKFQNSIMISSSHPEVENFELPIQINNVSDDVFGCTDYEACNFEDNATTDDGSCYFAPDGMDCIYPGDEMLGGTVIYVDSTGYQGIVASHENAHNSSYWGCNNGEMGAEFSDIGFGLTNTNFMMENCNWFNSASLFATEFIHEGFEDWYLPSLDELSLMIDVMGSNGLENQFYWSSTEYESNPTSYAWRVHFTNGPDYEGKTSQNRVRPVRNFNIYEDIAGCTDESACNYDANAVNDDGNCSYPPEGYECVSVGDEKFGGIVFYVDPTGTRGLVSADQNVTNSSAWGCYVDTDADSMGIGYGLENSLANVEVCNEFNNASLKSLEFEHNGFEDWYLPTLDDLILMHHKLGNGSILGNVGNFEDQDYWSSSENIENTSYAWTVHFSAGPQNRHRSSNYRVRAIRSFDLIEDLAGCTDASACNYDANAVNDDGNCSYPPEGYECVAVGDEKFGGIVFYVDSTGTRGLVSADQNVTNSSAWGCYVDTDADSMGIGYGLENSLANVDVCNEFNNASLKSLEYDLNGFDDWYLPSKDELTLMYHKLGSNSSLGNVGNFSNDDYWSSTENIDDISYAWTVHFSSGPQNRHRSSNYRVRAIRTFDLIEDLAGCTDESACNYDANAVNDDGNCSYPPEGYECVAVGDEKFGGIVFYVDSTGTSGLVSADQNVTNSSAWGCYVDTDADSVGIGYGLENSLANVEVCNEFNNASLKSLEYDLNGFDDWYLPSKDELTLMYHKLGSNSSLGNVGNFESQDYWSSTENIENTSYAWTIHFSSGPQNRHRSSNYRVRAVRTFDLIEDLAGCTDESACNFDATAVNDDGNCSYPPEGYECVSVGDEKFGGIVFYVDSTGTSGLVSATQNVTNSSAWGCYVDTDADSMGIGYGLENSIANIESCTGFNNASSRSLNWVQNNFDDWYLPSKDELNLMYHKLGSNSSLGNVGNFSNDDYWSSTENIDNISYAWTIHFSSGPQNRHRGSNYRVRAIRSFDLIEDLAGCTDESACNFNDNAVNDDNSCVFPPEGYECVSVGDEKFGGVVFYVDSSGTSGLVTSKENLHTTAQWGCQGTEIIGTSTNIGSGYLNTEAIVAGCAQSNLAAQYALDYEHDGHDDWYLPSLEEMKLIRHKVGHSNALFGDVAQFSNQSYWSSSEDNSNPESYAWLIYFDSGQASRHKSGGYRARAIRNFNLLEDAIGCADVDACNYSESFTIDDGSCEYPEEFYNCEGNCITDEDNDGICDEVDTYIKPPPGFEVSDNLIHLNIVQSNSLSSDYTFSITNIWDEEIEFSFTFENGTNITSDQVSFSESPITIQANEEEIITVSISMGDNNEPGDYSGEIHINSNVNELGEEILPVSVSFTEDWVEGCTDEDACNFSIYASLENETCNYPEEGIECVQIGDEKLGGIVFYVDETGFGGLIAAKDDATTSSRWGCRGTDISNADDSSLGSGQQNTSIVVEECNHFNNASLWSDLYEQNGYDDWYLPTIDEFNLLNDNIGYGALIGNIANLSHGSYYWSSTGESANNAWAYRVGYQSYEKYKDEGYRVRPIRTFNLIGDVAGCTDENACNYNENAVNDDGNCSYPPEGYECVSVGDEKFGGIVFFVDSTGISGLVSSLEDATTSSSWGCRGTDLSDADSTNLGYGQQNTSIAVEECSHFNNASLRSDIFEQNGYADWYLPTLDELILMNNKISSNSMLGNVGNLSGSSYYWSSSESSSNYAWSVRIGYQPYDSYKDEGYRVRPIRTFDLIGDLTGCTDESACNYNENAVNDDDSCSYPPEGYECVSVGDEKFGGIVFFVDSTGTSGLVSSLDDASTGSRWGCRGTDLSDADSTNLGFGQENTNSVIEECSHFDNASLRSDIFEYDGFNDWYLPSKDELILMNHKISGYSMLGNVGNFSGSSYYWSSSESSNNYAWSVRIGYQPYDSYKDEGYRVRPIRTFDLIGDLAGCTDESACNYNENAVNDDGNCSYPPEGYECVNVGDEKFGGIVFYVDSTGTSGLVSSIEDASTSSKWGCRGTDMSDADSTNLGFGQQNTNSVVEECKGFNNASLRSDLFEQNGFEDWYLPSVDELILMNHKLSSNSMLGNVGEFTNNSYYWSSSENSNNNAWSVRIGYQPYDSNKDESFRVRPIRTFDLIDDVAGCTDESACNYNVNAVNDDGNCSYPPEGYECVSVGDEKFGGIVFYVDSTGTSGLVSSLEDAYTSSKWGCRGTDISDADSTILGFGQENTNSIIEECSHFDNASLRSDLFEQNGYDDWYLPSKDELVLMNHKLSSNSMLGNVGQFLNNYQYWSSSEKNSTDAHAVQIGYYPVETSKDNTYRVRPIRTFDLIDDVAGCTDESACNYNVNAVNDDNSCTYPPEGYECVSVGDEKFGGIVFYVDSTGTSGLVSSLEDASTSSKWGCRGTDISVADSTNLGFGQQNTSSVVEECKGFNNASLRSDLFEQNGYDDWYLPSKDELILMNNKLSGNSMLGNIGELDNNNNYWSSSEKNSTDAHAVRIGYYPVETSKDNTYRVRPIRTFDLIDDVAGCTDESACNYNVNAVNEDNSCTYPPEGYECVSVGDEKFGGIVFYVDSTGTSGLVSSLEDASTSSRWGCRGTDMSDADSTNLGFGQENTNSVVGECNHFNNASLRSDLFEHNGFEDWYLPSIDELVLMNHKLSSNSMLGNVGQFLNNYQYWSSSEKNSTDAHAVQIGYYPLETSKDNNYRVRPVRTFDLFADVAGCTDDNACNYNESAIYDDASCIYPFGNFECLSVGENAFGGVIFHIDSTGANGLIISTNDADNSEQWGCYGTEIGTENELGTGSQNSEMISENCSGNNSAAKRALDFEYDGFNDWYLPSVDELILANNIVGTYSSLGNVASLSNSEYWSSTESEDNPANNAFKIHYNNGKSEGNKNSNYRVRAIRSFGVDIVVDFPPIAMDTTFMTIENNPVSITLNGSDPENAIISYVMSSSPENGTLSGEIPNLTYTPAEGWYGTDSFQYYVNDGNNDSQLATVTIVVNPDVFKPPVFTECSNYQPIFIQDIIGNGISFDPTVDEIGVYDGDVCVGEAVISEESGQIVYAYTDCINGNGFTEGNPITIKLYDLETGIVHADIATHFVQIDNWSATGLFNEDEIAGVELRKNTTPRFTSEPVTTVNEDIEYNYSISVSDSEYMLGDSYLFEITNAPEWLSIIDNGDQTGTLTGTSDLNFNGTINVSIQVIDSFGQSASQSFVITVNPVNDIPEFTSEPIVSILEDELYNYSLSGTDIDGDNVSFSQMELPEWLSLVTENDSTAITGIPLDEHSGQEFSVTLSIEDGNGGVSLQSYAIEVIPVNDAPTIADIPDETILSPEVSYTQINLNDFVDDLETSDEDIIWTVSGDDDLTVTIINQIATISTPEYWFGSQTLTFIATDTDPVEGDELSSLEDATFSRFIEHTYNLNSGWDWKSFSIIPFEETDADSFFHDILDNLMIVKSQYDFFIPGQEADAFTMENNSAYMIRNEEDISLTVTSGKQINPADTVQIEEGWTWVGYYGNSTNDALDVFEDLSDYLTIVKAHSGVLLFNTPFGDINAIGDLFVDNGYLINSTIDTSFVWPDATEYVAREIDIDESNDPIYFLYEKTQTFEPVIVSIKNSEEFPIMESAEIGLFINDYCIGGGMVHNSELITLQAWGESSLIGEKIQVRLFNGMSELIVHDGIEIIDYDEWDKTGKYNPNSILGFELDAGEFHKQLIPDEFLLHQNYPNPFNPRTNIKFDLPEETHVNINIYNIHGQLIKQLLNDKTQAGYHNIIWDGINESGIIVPTGLYFYQVKLNGELTATKKMLMIK